MQTLDESIDEINIERKLPHILSYKTHLDNQMYTTQEYMKVPTYVQGLMPSKTSSYYRQQLLFSYNTRVDASCM